jgi:hypothetical protein
VSSTIREFVTVSLGVIALYLVLAHYTGAEGTITATGKSTAEIFKTLQGR